MWRLRCEDSGIGDSCFRNYDLLPSYIDLLKVLRSKVTSEHFFSCCSIMRSCDKTISLLNSNSNDIQHKRLTFSSSLFMYNAPSSSIFFLVSSNFVFVALDSFWDFSSSRPIL